MINLCIIGAGEVVKKRYSNGLIASKNAQEFCVRWLYDILPEKEITTTLKYFPKAKYTQISESIKKAGEHILKETPPDAVVIIATPTPTHIPYALQLIDRFCLIAIEKPATNSLETLINLENKCFQVGKSWFPLAYYLIEKALPYLVLMKKELQIPPYLNLLTPRLTSKQLTELRSDLGLPRKLVGCILEGGDTSSGHLDDRKWVLTPKAGGNTWETLFHLSSLITTTSSFSEEKLNIPYSYRGVIEEIGINDNSNILEDTAHLTCIETDKLSSIIFSAKYLHPDSCQRWLKVSCEGGEVMVDFSNAAMMIETKNQKVHYQLIDKTPYAAQFSLLSERHRNPKMPLPENTYKKAVKLNQNIYDFGKTKKTNRYKKNIRIEELIDTISSKKEGLFPLDQRISIPRIQSN